MTPSNGGPGEGGRGGREEDERRSDRSSVPGARRLKRVAASSGSHAGRAYQGAIEAVFAIVIATGIGYWVDSRYGTSPRWLIVGAVVGFGAFVLRLARMANLIEDPNQSHAGPDPTPRDERESHEARDDEPGGEPDDEWDDQRGDR